MACLSSVNSLLNIFCSATHSSVKRLLILAEPVAASEIKDYLQTHPLPPSLTAVYCETSSYDNLLTLYNECCQLIRNGEIDTVISTEDLSALVHAALVETFPHIRGPSFESAFLSSHKLYCRDLIATKESNLNYAAYHINDDNAIDNLKYPIIVKPCLGFLAVGIFIAKNPEDLKNNSADMANVIENSLLSPVSDLVQKFLSLERYPLALNELSIAEEYLEDRRVNRILTVDSYVFNGEITKWAISENTYWPHKPVCYKSMYTPAEIDIKVQDEIWQTQVDLYHNMKKYGFNNQFLNMEFFVIGDNQKIKLMEINARAPRMMVPLFVHTMDNGYIYNAAASIAQGIRPQQHYQKPNVCAALYCITTFGTGKARDFMDFEEMANYPLTEIMAKADDDVTPQGDGGVILGYVTIVDDSYNSCLKKMEELKHRFVKQTQFSPWFTHE